VSGGNAVELQALRVDPELRRFIDECRSYSGACSSPGPLLFFRDDGEELELCSCSCPALIFSWFVRRFDAPVARMALPTAVVAGAATSLAVAVLVAARRDRTSSDTGSSEAPPTTLGIRDEPCRAASFTPSRDSSRLTCVWVRFCAAEWGRFGRTASAPEFHGARQFSLEELAQATKNFAEANLVGAGSFGLVYKGLLLDGTVVAVKRRDGAPRQDLADEVVRCRRCVPVPYC
jgi:hypothetical protein